MGRYVYDSNLVTQAIDELNQAVNSLSTINTDIQAGISTINSATGANCIEVNYSKLLELQTLAEEVIEEDIRIIQEKVTIIEEYESAPWYKKLFASVGMALTKFGEGIVSAVEDLGDGVVSIAGFVGGIFNSEFKASCAEYIEKDHVGDWFNKQYEDGGALEGLQVYSWYSKDSTAANIFKGIGCAAPYVALSMTGVGLVTETVAAGIGGIGSGTESGLQKTAFERAELKASLDQQVAAGTMTQAEADAAMTQATNAHYNKAFAEGLWQGTKNAALVYGMGKLAQGIQANAAAKLTGGGKVVAGSADDFVKLTGSNMDEVAATAKKVFGSTDDLIAQSVNGKVQLYNAKTFEVVGDITIDGTNAIVRNFANSGVPVATRVLANSGDEILYNVIKNTDDLVGSTFDDLARATTDLTRSERVFDKAGKFGNTKAGQVLNASDDALTNVGSKVANSKVGQVVSNTGARIVGSKPVQAIINSNAVQKVSTAVANTVAKHPVATFGVAATAFTADQIGEQQVGSEYRLASEVLDAATVKTMPDFEPTPTINYETPVIGETPPSVTTPVGTPPGVTTPVGTPPGVTTPVGTPPGGTPGGTTPGGGTIVTPEITTPVITTPEITTPIITTPEITTPEITTPEITTPEITTPEITTPVITTPEITLPGGGDTGGGTPSGGGGYTGGGYTGEIPETGEGEITLPDGELISDSFTELITGNNEYTKIPTSSAPITTTTTTGAKKSIIPVIAGLSAAAVAGIGTKAYLDKKEETDSEETFDSEEWTDDSLEVDYNDAMEQDGDYLDPTDEYAYQEEGEPAGSYEAVNSSELASMQ